eukprot:2281941-Pleurochrysis_carterae.AAC.6
MSECARECIGTWAKACLRFCQRKHVKRCDACVRVRANKRRALVEPDDGGEAVDARSGIARQHLRHQGVQFAGAESLPPSPRSLPLLLVSPLFFSFPRSLSLFPLPPLPPPKTMGRSS